MNPGDNNLTNEPITKGTFFYGWVIVAACTIQQAMQYGMQYTYGIFFKPLIVDFGWSRATTSGVYSLFMIIGGVFAIPAGWFADKFGPAKVGAICGFITGLGLVLTSQISELWQLYLTFGIIVGIGMSGVFAIGAGTTARWFVKQRGFALGIVSAGVGLGTLIMSPVAERLIAAFGWSTAYLIIGIIAWVFMITSALFLRRSPEEIGLLPYGGNRTSMDEFKPSNQQRAKSSGSVLSVTLWKAFHSGPLWMLVFIYLVLTICVQMIMVHLVNYATDLGIDPLIAATIISVIGFGSVAGRLVMGAASDRIGSSNALIMCCLITTASLIWLIYARELWMLYLFAVVFSIAYGGEVPQMALLVGQFFGLRSVSTLIGIIILGARAGGALGSWMGGQIFDMTHSYSIAFIIAAVASLLGLLTAIMLKKAKTNDLSHS